MSSAAPTHRPGPPSSADTPACKPCCACPETKRQRDDCIITKGEEACTQFIEAHKECMRKHGFKA